ncbi:MAG TPA: anti-sigma factor [Candidatus Acidoferrales bacterium]|nr:anti-sigma factor [Candidatus Acidoferrales bacterium]HEV2299641.1 anti-sigma factor [Candidatus Acidoferrales bacterium]
MNCRSVVRELSNYLDGELDLNLQQSIEIHLEHCEDCHLLVDTTKKTIQIFCKSEPLPLSDDVRNRLHDALVKRLHKPRS